MSRLYSGASEISYNIKTFRGVNENADGDANLKAGEAAIMRNFKITDGNALKVRPGYELAIEGFEPQAAIDVMDESALVTTISMLNQKIEFFAKADIVDGDVVLSGSLGVLDLFTAEGRQALEEFDECYFKFMLDSNREQTFDFRYTQLETKTAYSGATVYGLYGKAIYSPGIAGMWSGMIGGEEILLFARDFKIYKQTYKADGTPNPAEEIGYADTRLHVDAFFFDDKIYFLDGSGYYSYDGQTFSLIMDGYIPCVITAAEPATGSGTMYEQVNKLSANRKVRYSADGTSTTYHIVEDFSAISRVEINGVEAESTDYTYDSTAKTITFNTAPPSGSANVEITYSTLGKDYDECYFSSAQSANSNVMLTNVDWKEIVSVSLTHGEETHDLYEGADYVVYGGKFAHIKLLPEIPAATLIVISGKSKNQAFEIYKMRFAETFNGAADTRAFLYGDGTNKAIYSGVTEDGKPSAEYFPDLNEMEVGDANTPISAMIRHYNRLLVFKRGGGTYSIYYGQISLADGSITAGFYINSINKRIGCGRDDGAVIVDNRPRTIEHGNIYEWRATSTSGNLTADQRNAQVVSERVHDTLRGFNMEKALSFYDIRRHEYYCVYNGVAVVQNTQNDTWYIYTNFPATIMAEHGTKLYFGTANGMIYRLGDEIETDNGEPIEAFWESGSLDFGKPNYLKYSPTIWLSAIAPEYKTKDDKSFVDASIVTDRDEEVKNTFMFLPENAMAMTLMSRLKARKFTYYKLRFAIKPSGIRTGRHATIISTVIKAYYDKPVKRNTGRIF